MFVKMVTNTAKPGHEADYLAAAKSFAEDMGEVPGCESACVWQDASDPSSIANVEVWESAESCASYDGHVFLAHKAELKPHFAGNVTKTFEVR